jgi:hypothetical protein
MILDRKKHIERKLQSSDLLNRHLPVDLQKETRGSFQWFTESRDFLLWRKYHNSISPRKVSQTVILVISSDVSAPPRHMVHQCD